MTEATKRPWEMVHQVASGVDLGFRVRKQGGGYIVASCNNEHATEANAELIVTAVNAHDRLLADNKRLREALMRVLTFVQHSKATPNIARMEDVITTALATESE